MVRFDTLDKKPKLYILLILGVATLAAVVLLSLGGMERNALVISILISVFCLAALVLLLRAWVRQLRYNPYSYNTILYVGFWLFTLSVLVTNVLLEYRMLRTPEMMHTRSILSTLLYSARQYMLISAPFILLFSVGLFVSNVSLIRHEGRRPVNFLGMLLALLLVGGEAYLWFYDYAFSGSERQAMFHDLWASLFAAFYLYFECMLIGAIVASTLVAKYEPDPDRDAIIVLGCGIRKDGTPTPLLRGRLDRALAFARQQEETTGKPVTFITSGGQGPNEVVSESACMKRYLLEQGVPESRILEENQSTDTMENMRFSKEKAADLGPGAKVAFSTSDYHVFRSGLYARRVKMRAVGMGAVTRWYFWPNAAVREFVGLLTGHRLKQGLVLGSLVVFYVVLTLLVYSV